MQKEINKLVDDNGGSLSVSALTSIPYRTLRGWQSGTRKLKKWMFYAVEALIEKKSK